MESRAYAFAFLAVLGIVCLGAYIAVSALVDSSGAPIISLNETPVPRELTSTRSATRTPTRPSTPTSTPVVILTVILPTNTPFVLPTATWTLPPFPTPRLIFTPTPRPTATPTPTEVPSPTPVPPTPTPLPTNTSLPPPAPTSTAAPSGFLYRQDGPIAPDPNKDCSGQYIFGTVRDANNAPLPGVRIRLKDSYKQDVRVRTKSGIDAGVYDHQIGITPQLWTVLIVDAGDTPLSAAVNVNFEGVNSGKCWLRLNWRRVN